MNNHKFSQENIKKMHTFIKLCKVLLFFYVFGKFFRFLNFTLHQITQNFLEFDCASGYAKAS